MDSCELVVVMSLHSFHFHCRAVYTVNRYKRTLLFSCIASDFVFSTYKRALGGWTDEHREHCVVGGFVLQEGSMCHDVSSYHHS